MPLCSPSVLCLTLGPRLSGGIPASSWVLSPPPSSFYSQQPAQCPAHSRYSTPPRINSHSGDPEAPPKATSCMAGSHQLTWAKHVYVESSQLRSQDAPDQLPPPTHTSFSDVYRKLAACPAPGNRQPPHSSDWALTSYEAPWFQDPLVAGKRSRKNPRVIKDKAASFQ